MTSELKNKNIPEKEIGIVGRKTVEEKFSLNVNAPAFLKVIMNAATDGK